MCMCCSQAVVQLCLGQASGSAEQLKAAQQYFQVVGSSPSECDTIPGRQAMASCFFLLKQFEDVLVFLSVSCLMPCGLFQQRYSEILMATCL